MLVIPCVKKNPRESLCCFRSGIRSYSVGDVSILQCLFFFCLNYLNLSSIVTLKMEGCNPFRRYVYQPGLN